MNRKEAAELIPVIQAFLEGKTIERKTRSWEFNKGWRDATQWEETEKLICRDTFVYRIKPESKYRPFANAEEYWNEMLKHQPFGWTKLIGENGYSFIGDVDDEIIYSDAFKEYTFADGTPFGIKEE